MITYHDCPMITCPACHREFQLEDYYDLREGSGVDCPRCEVRFEVTSVDVTMTIGLQASEPPL